MTVIENNLRYAAMSSTAAWLAVSAISVFLGGAYVAIGLSGLFPLGVWYSYAIARVVRIWL